MVVSIDITQMGSEKSTAPILDYRTHCIVTLFHHCTEYIETADIRTHLPSARMNFQP